MKPRYEAYTRHGMSGVFDNLRNFTQTFCDSPDEAEREAERLNHDEEMNASILSRPTRKQEKCRGISV